jgi:hypothetical protein
LSICGIIKGVKVFFKGFCFAIFIINDFPDVAVCSTAYFFDDFKF